MSLLQHLVASIQANVDLYENEIVLKGDGIMPHLWEAHRYPQLDDETYLTSEKIFRLMEEIRLDLHALESIVTPSRHKLLNIVLSPAKTAALNVAVSLGISDAILELGGSAKLDDLALKLDVNENKLGRILRVLAAEFIYAETSPNVFSNTRHSIVLLKEENAEPFLSLTAVQNTISTTGLLNDLTSLKSKESFSATTAPFTTTVAKNGESFMEYIIQPENATVLDKVAKGVAPWLNKTTRAALLEDYPWSELSDATIVDVGCGPADSAFDIMKKFPKLRWIFQDFEPVIRNLKQNISLDLGPRIACGEISFIIQDYFVPNVSLADVWFLRGVMYAILARWVLDTSIYRLIWLIVISRREYGDEEALKILINIAMAMKRTPGARMLINEILCSSPVVISASTGPDAVPSKYIPADQSTITETANLMAWSATALFGGKERSYSEFENLIEQAGLKISRFFKFRSITVMIECLLID